MRDTVLIDGDILAFQVASAAEVPTEFADDIWVLWADAKLARKQCDDAIEAIMTMTDTTQYEIALTGGNNFRYGISDSYKSNRRGKRKPMILSHLREYLTDRHNAQTVEKLEGDDLLGIWLTGEYKDTGVMYSADKDLRTVPGYHYADGLIEEVTPEAARKFFYTQVLTGDATDGYKGCPGVGPVKAQRVLEEDCSWEAVVSLYESKGLTEEDALVQARLAYILHNHNFNNGKITHWEPTEGQ